MPERNSLLEELNHALGPLASLYNDPDVLEILVDSPERVLIEQDGKLQDASVKFDSEAALISVIESTLALGGIERQPRQSTVEARLPGGTRVLAVYPPTALDSPCLVVRKPLTPLLTWENLFEFGSITRQAHEFLTEAIDDGLNILVSGGTGSGKTTVLRLLANDIPPHERVLVVQSVMEMQIQHPRAVLLEASTAGDASFEELIHVASKMRPDWMIIGELLGRESMTALEILNRGHSGMTTIHATGVEDALSRLEAGCLMANLGLGLREIRTLIASALQLITHQEKLKDGSRKITQVMAINGLDNERYVLQPLFRFNLEKGLLERI
jgi:pilus assembly protein CpaF